MTVAPDDTVQAFVGAPAIMIEGALTGPLAGTSLAVKDLFDIAGTVTGGGTPAFAEDHLPAVRTAAAVTALVSAGATVVGKTITDELAYSLSGTNTHFGTPVNVNAPGRVPGGSSAGSAAAVAAGLVDLALGTDTGGSIRVPASYCGVVGWRPTHGAVPMDGIVPLAPSFDVAGLFARDLSLLAAAADVLLTSLVDAMPGEISRVSVLVEALEDSSDEVGAVVSALAGVLDASPGRLGIDLPAAMAAFRTLQGHEAWASHGTWIRTRAAGAGTGFGRGIASRFDAASQITAEQLPAAAEVRAQVLDAVLRTTAGGTVLLMPGAAGAAPPRHGGVAPSGGDGDPFGHEAQRMRTLRLTCIAGLAGAPVVVLPVASVAGDGPGETLPLGLALVGAPGSDRSLLRFASTVLHRLTDGRGEMVTS